MAFILKSIQKYSLGTATPQTVLTIDLELDDGGEGRGTEEVYPAGEVPSVLQGDAV